jgi:L,D-transpeptidase YcbB
VAALRRRLGVSGDYQGAASDSPLYDAPLAEAVRVFQRRHLLTADGVVGAATLRELNVPVAARVGQLRINLERGRWVLHEIGDQDLVVVDIAGYGIRYLRNRRSIWRARAIVGQRFRQTPVFRAQIDTVVFNPTWTVPPGILAKDVLPQMQRGENVLARKQLQVYDRDGAQVEPATIDWSKYTAGSFPYVLRQDAGDGNALGRVKINFPNPYLVYLHDTPTRSLFDRDDRTFSSGCIRVERPLELVELLLDDPVRWNAAGIRAAVDALATRTVTLQRKVPVLLMYWTADEDPDGRIVFKRDLYHRDARLLRALDGRFSFGGRVRA